MRAVFRCDASPEIGAGHVSRCIAFGEALAATGWHVAFASRHGTAAMVPAVVAAPFSLCELDGTAEDEVIQLRARYPDGIDLFVADHYQRDVHFEEACRPFTRQILVLEDATGRPHDCDFLLDAATTNCSAYQGRVPAQARLLLGPTYALVRRSFIARRAEALRRRDGRPVENILISFGATDPMNVTAIALDALAPYADEISITIALSSRAPHVETVRARLPRNARLVLDAANMAELITDADIGLGGAGTSGYERAVLGLPSLLLRLADNQRGIAALMVQAGAALDAGTLDAGLGSRLRGLVGGLMADPAARTRHARAAAALVDGRGAARIMVAALDPAAAKDATPVRLRLAEPADESWLLDLQREPDTRRHSRNPAVPNADEHHRWMARTLADPARLLMIVEAGYAPVGMLRLDRLAERGGPPHYEVSLVVRAAFGNRGIGTAALALARRLLPGAVLKAGIALANVTSRRAFARAGFRPAGGDLMLHDPSQGGRNREDACHRPFDVKRWTSGGGDAIGEGRAG